MTNDTQNAEINGLERLAIADAFVKYCQDAIKGMRENENNKIMQQFFVDDVTQKRVTVNGKKVGTFSVTLTKPIAGSFPQIDNAEEFVEWLRTSDGGLDTLKRLVSVKPDLVLDAAIADGELPDGCKMVERYEPAHIKNTVLKVDKKKVADALHFDIDTSVRALLDGGNGDGE